MKYIKLFENFQTDEIFKIRNYELYNSDTKKVIQTDDDAKPVPRNIDINTIKKRILDFLDKPSEKNLGLGLATKQLYNNPEDRAMDIASSRLANFLNSSNGSDHLVIRGYFHKPLRVEYSGSNGLKSRDPLEKISSEIAANFDIYDKEDFPDGSIMKISLFLDMFIEFVEEKYSDINKVFKKYKIKENDYVNKFIIMEEIGMPITDHLSEFITFEYKNDFQYLITCLGEEIGL